MTRTWR